MAEVCNAVPETFLVFSGDDAVTLPLIALGGMGIISVASNEIPREMAEMTRAALANDWETARAHPPEISAADAGKFHRDQSHAGEGSAGDDGQDRRELSSAPAAHAPRDAIQAAKDRCRSGIDRQTGDRGGPRPPISIIYENWLAGPHKIVLHRSSCGQCNHGKGRPAGHDANHARWHGPYATLTEARETSQHMAGVLIRSECKCI